MDRSERRARIRANLGIEPINHGQVHTFQIAVSESDQQNIALERLQIIEDTLTQHKSNLIPLIVRRTQAYSEEEEYEVVYGADWCLVAKELDIEKLWVWVFDLTDEQAAATKAEMQQLFGESSSTPGDLEKLLEQKLQPIYTKLRIIEEKTATRSLESEKQVTPDQSLNKITEKIETLSLEVRELIKLLKPPDKLNLCTATKDEISDALAQAGVTLNFRSAAWKAIEYWRQPGRNLSWDNLEKSAGSGREPYNIKNFGSATYDKLREIGNIPNL